VNALVTVMLSGLSTTSLAMLNLILLQSHQMIV